MKKYIVYFLSILIVVVIFLGGSFLYNNYTSKGGAVVLVEEKIISDNKVYLTVQYQSGDFETLEIHPITMNLIETEVTYFISYTQRIFDKYKIINSIEESNTSWKG